MKLLVKRIARRDTYTIGRLYVDGVYECDTLEDRDRGLRSDMPLVQITSKKVYGETAIPMGTYEITMVVKSPKYSAKPNYSFTSGYMPRFLRIPGFEGVLIHGGNTDKDTLGCLLVGQNKVVGKLINSLDTFKKLYAKLIAASKRGEKITITIE